MFRLQGMDPTKFKVVVSDTKLGQLIGNSMSVNVVERILTRALEAAGLAEDLQDRWETGQASRKLQATVGKSFQKMPEPFGEYKQCSLPQFDDEYRDTIDDFVHRRYIVDSGASIHLIDAKTMTNQERRDLKPLEFPIRLQTANGFITAEYSTSVYVLELDVWIEAVVMDNTPPVLSLGLLVEQNGFTSVWEPRCIPTLYKDGKAY